MERKPVVIPQEALEKEAAVCGQIKALWASRGRTPRPLSIHLIFFILFVQALMFS